MCIYSVASLLAKQKGTICPTTFRFQETEMRADVVFHCLFSFCLLPFMHGSIFVISLIKEHICLELFLSPSPKLLPELSKASVFLGARCLSHRRSGEYSCGYLPKWVHHLCKLQRGGAPSPPVPRLSALSKYGLRFQDQEQVRKYCG